MRISCGGLNNSPTQSDRKKGRFVDSFTSTGFVGSSASPLARLKYTKKSPLLQDEERASQNILNLVYAHKTDNR